MSLPAQKDDDGADRPSGARAIPGARSLSEIARGAKDKKPKRRGVPRTSEQSAEAARAQVQKMMESADWGAATGLHLVVFYEWLHREVYGIDALEVDSKTRFIASQVANRFVATYFAGDFGACVSFMHWAWRREESREEWRRANGVDGKRVGWRLQFSAALVTDYRLHAARTEKR